MAIFTGLANSSSFERISLTEGVVITAALYLLYLVGLATLGDLNLNSRPTSTDNLQSSCIHSSSRQYDTFPVHGMPDYQSFPSSGQRLGEDAHCMHQT
jgi:hypothetical protein